MNTVKILVTSLLRHNIGVEYLTFIYLYNQLGAYNIIKSLNQSYKIWFTFSLVILETNKNGLSDSIYGSLL